VVLAKVALGVVVVAAVGVGGVAVLGQSKRPSPARDGNGTLEVHEVARTSFDITTAASGELEAKNQTELRNKLEGNQSTIVQIVEEGRFVKAGDLLIKLNDEEIKNKLTEAESQLESARAEEISAREDREIQVSQNDSSLRAARLKLELARLDLAQWLEGEVKQKRQENSLALERARRELTRLKDKYDQSIALERQGFLSKDELKRDELAWLEAVAALDKAVLAEQVYETYQYPKDEKTKQSAVEEALAELDRVEKKNTSELASKEASLANRRRQTALREENLQKLRTQLAACTITAPKDGLVVYGPTAEGGRSGGWFMRGDGPFGIGTQVWPNQLLIVLPDTSEMVATVKVHESVAGRVREGLPATVKVDALGGRAFRGTVQSIGVLAEQTTRWMDPNLREYTVKIALDTAGEPGLKPSMRCDAEINLGRVDDALAVPIQAIFNEGMLRYVYTPAGAGGKYARRPVAIGRRSDRFAEVTAGLEAGERVLLRQPTPGEVLDRPFTEQELAAVGLRLSPEGKIESAVAMTGGPGGARGDGPPGPGRPRGGRGPGGGGRPGGPAGSSGSADAAASAPPATPPAAAPSDAPTTTTPPPTPAPTTPATTPTATTTDASDAGAKPAEGGAPAPAPAAKEPRSAE
jgi:multidrug efflux pump subunit AcrA (membrane-fusion protein)